jgi:hypothetical protein
MVDASYARYKGYVGSKWAKPIVGSVRKQMRYAFENRKELKAKFKETAKLIRRDWNWDIAGKRMGDFLKSVC